MAKRWWQLKQTAVVTATHFAGLTQAELHQAAFHSTYLAGNAGSIPERLKALARLKNTRQFPFADTVQVVYEPDARLQLREAHRAVSSARLVLQANQNIYSVARGVRLSFFHKALE